jgi:hypothetical protein
VGGVQQEAVLAKIADHLLAQLGVVVDNEDVAGGKDAGLRVHGLTFLTIVAQLQPRRHNRRAHRKRLK